MNGNGTKSDKKVNVFRNDFNSLTLSSPKNANNSLGRTREGRAGAHAYARQPASRTYTRCYHYRISVNYDLNT
jgi:succinate dehydrogenase/fumarate reductase flavoprotein subunit